MKYQRKRNLNSPNTSETQRWTSTTTMTSVERWALFKNLCPILLFFAFVFADASHHCRTNHILRPNHASVTISFAIIMPP